MTTRVRIAKATDKGYEGLPGPLVEDIEPLVMSTVKDFSGETDYRRELLSPHNIDRGYYLIVNCKDKETAIEFSKELLKKIGNELGDEYKRIYYIGIRIGGGYLSKGAYRSIKEVAPDDIKS